MSEVLSGTNWEVRRKFVSANEAMYASTQLSLLLDEGKECIEELIPTEAWDGEKMTVYKVNVAKLRDFWRVGETAITTGMLNIYDASEAEAQNGLDEFFLNFYLPLGSTNQHRDSYENGKDKTRSTVTVGLVGTGIVEVQDPSTEEEHVITLNAGDSFHLNNDVPEEERPLHLVKNTLEVPRIALVNG